MVFSSTIFIFLFLPVLLIFYFNPIFKSTRYKNGVLLFASVVFYAWGEPIYVFLMVFCILTAWILGIRLDKETSKNKRKTVLSIGIALFVIILFIFKYLVFAADQLCLLIWNHESKIEISLPIGISFFLFQLMSYLFDVYYKKAPVQKNIFKLALYISLFPQLIAGPIVRYDMIAMQLDQRTENFDNFSMGIKRFVHGLAKKVLLANYLAVVADNVFDYFGVGGGKTSIITLWIGAIAYTLQIYFDFSAYSDMAIGLGKMFGFEFAENFNYPYIAKSVTDFWRRWHISLSSWFRDYVYIPLGGNRVTKRRWILNLFAVWLLTGVWHGANWTFLCWGLFYFLILILEKLTGFEKKLGLMAHLYTILVIVIAWVMFRADNMSVALSYIASMFGIRHLKIANEMTWILLKNSIIILIIAIWVSMPIYKKFNQITEKSIAGNILDSLLTLMIFGLSIVACVSSTYNPFIYFNF